MRPSILLALMASSVGALAARFAFLSLPRTTLSIRTSRRKITQVIARGDRQVEEAAEKPQAPEASVARPTCLTRLAFSKALGRHAPSHASEPHAGYVANTGDAALHEILTRGGMSSMMTTTAIPNAFSPILVVHLHTTALYADFYVMKDACHEEAHPLLLVGIKSLIERRPRISKLFEIGSSLSQGIGAATHILSY